MSDVFSVAGGKANLTLRPDGILHLIWAPGTYVKAEYAISAITMMNRISPDQDRPMLVDMRNVGNTSSRAREGHCGCVASVDADGNGGPARGMQGMQAAVQEFFGQSGAVCPDPGHTASGLLTAGRARIWRALVP